MARRRSGIAGFLSFVPAATALALAQALPYELRVAFGGWVGRLLIRRVPRFRRRVEANLSFVMPELSASARTEIAFRVGDTFGRTFVEIFSMEEFQRRRTWIGPEGPGVDVISSAAATGTGALVVTGHFGQWEAGRAWLKTMGRECAAVYRPLNDARLDRIYVANLEAGGRPMFVKGGRGLRGLLGHLSKGGIAAILTDQYERRAERFDFLGRPAPTTSIAAELALKLGIPLIPAYGLRAPDGIHVTVVLEAPIPHTTAAEMTQALNDSLAERVRADPGQYLWLHRRWEKDLPGFRR